MTTIAWDGRTLAADRMAVGGCTKRCTTKLWDCGLYVFGGAGCLDEVYLAKEWLEIGAPPDARPKRDDSSILGIAVHKASIAAFMVEGKQLVLCRMRDRLLATGSGGEFALAAMHLGKTAAQAVAFASQLDAFSGLGVDAVHVRPEARRKARR